MTILPKISVNVDEYLGANKYNVDEENAHIKLTCEDYVELPDEEWGKLVRICPAALYRSHDDGTRAFDYAGCLECGTCRIACEATIVAKWNNPEPTMGVQYRYG